MLQVIGSGGGEDLRTRSAYCIQLKNYIILYKLYVSGILESAAGNPFSDASVMLAFFTTSTCTSCLHARTINERTSLRV